MDSSVALGDVAKETDGFSGSDLCVRDFVHRQSDGYEAPPPVMSHRRGRGQSPNWARPLCDVISHMFTVNFFKLLLEKTKFCDLKSLICINYF